MQPAWSNARGDGSITRTNWGAVAKDSRKMAQALEKLGVKPGDRVATLAMNLDHRVRHRRRLMAEGVFPPSRD